MSTYEDALDTAQVIAAITPVAQVCLGAQLQVRHVDAEVLRRRNKRCVFRYQVHAYDPAQATEVRWNVIGKVMRADLGEAVFARMQQLWKHGFARGATDGISIPEPLEFVACLNMLLQEEIPGVSFKILLKQAAHEQHFRHLARTLIKLHTCPIVLHPAFTVRNHLMRCHPKHGFLSLACPELAASVDYIVGRAYAIEAAFGAIQPALLHGDFHLGQIHTENGQVWLIDFDALSYGDPASDLGNLLVFLKNKARKDAVVCDLMHAFLDEYFAHMDPQIATRIPLYEGLTHLRRACKSLRLQEDGWRQRAARMVAQGVACLEGMDGKPTREMAPAYPEGPASG